MGENGNLSDIRSARLQARVEIEQPFNLPKGAIVCEINFDFAQQSFRYDDQAFLVLNDYFIFATQLAEGAATPDGNLLKYDWLKVRGTVWVPGLHKPICIGQAEGGTCRLPPSDESGLFDVRVPKHITAELALRLKDESTHSFKLIGAGEGTPGTDCHIKEPLAFDVIAKYFLP